MATQESARALLLDNVVKTYGAIRAVDGVSFAALLSGLFVPDSGRIEVMGHDMRRDPVPALAMLGIMFQQPTLDLELSVTGNLLFHAGLHGIPRAVARPRIEKELARLGLAERAHDTAGQLSGLKLILSLRAERSVAVLWATHLCDEVPNADRVIVLHRGKVLADTTPAGFVANAGMATVEQAFLAMTGP